jgi:spore germination protein GerM
MTVRRVLAVCALAAVAAALAWVLFIGLPKKYGGPGTKAAAAVSQTAPVAPGRKISVRLYYISDDGTRLTAVEREVAYGEGTVQQAKEVVNAQLAPVAEPLVSAIPQGTKLRELFVTENGTAFVDLSREVATAHTGGTLNELLTVYTIVDVLTANLPAVTSVQILIDGKEVETLAGHIDLRRPLAKNVEWIQES